VPSLSAGMLTMSRTNVPGRMKGYLWIARARRFRCRYADRAAELSAQSIEKVSLLNLVTQELLQPPGAYDGTEQGPLYHSVIVYTGEQLGSDWLC
jgi:hypothetical protein